MIQLETKIDKFSIAYKPLTVTGNLEIAQKNGVDSDGSGVIQTYDVLGGGYYPDYTVFPLVLQPTVYAYDPDNVIGRGLVDVTKDVANMKWWAVDSSGKTLLQNTTEYEITTSGEKKGRLRFKRNVLPDIPVTLIYEADYLDTRTNEVYPVRMTQIVRADVLKELNCKLSLDCASQLFYNPLKKVGNTRITKQTIHAQMFSGNNKVLPNMCKCVWMLSNDNGTSWSEFGSDITNAFGVVSADTLSLEVDMDMMGDSVTIRCYGIVSDDPTALASMTEASAFDNVQVRITRKIPKFTATMQRFPTTISVEQKDIYPKLVIDFSRFDTNDPLQEMDATWLTSRVGSNTETVVGKGLEPTIPTNLVTATQSQQVKVELKDRGSWKILTDGQGRVITDGSGKVIAVR